MRLATKGRYAIIAMLDLTIHRGEGPITLAEMSYNQGISLSYLEQLFACLRARQLVRGVRGPGGGYYLGRAAEDISIADILCAVDEWVEFTHRSNKEDCLDAGRSFTRDLWDELSNEIFEFLSGITLSELVARGGLKEQGYIEDQQKVETSDIKPHETIAA